MLREDSVTASGVIFDDALECAVCARVCVGRVVERGERGDWEEAFRIVIDFCPRLFPFPLWSKVPSKPVGSGWVRSEGCAVSV